MKSITSKRKAQTARRRYYTNKHKESSGYLETFITQCIVCGIILSAVLIIRIIDVPTTNAMRQQFYQAITATVDIAADIQNVRSSLLATFEEESLNNIHPVQESIPSYTNPSEQDFRIDEDILESIRGGGNSYR